MSIESAGSKSEKGISAEIKQLREGRGAMTYDDVKRLVKEGPQVMAVQALGAEEREGYTQLSREEKQDIAESLKESVLRYAANLDTNEFTEEDLERFAEHIKGARARADFLNQLADAFEKSAMKKAA